MERNPHETDLDRPLSREEAAAWVRDYFDVTITAAGVYSWTSKGLGPRGRTLPALKVGRSLRIRPRDVISFLEAVQQDRAEDYEQRREHWQHHRRGAPPALPTDRIGRARRLEPDR